MTRALTALAVLALAGAAQAQDTAPAFSAGNAAFAYYGTVCDCDERDFVFRTLGPLAGHAEPDDASPVVRTVDAGRLIEGNDWDTVVTVVTRPAMGTLRVPMRLDEPLRMIDARVGNWETATRTPDVTLPAGTHVSVYSNYGGEGLARYGGVTYYGAVPMDAEVEWEPGSGDVPDDEAWYRLVARRGAPAAWVRIDIWRDEPNVEVLCGTHTDCVEGFTPSYRPSP